ncbi:MAG: hypothetical protein EAZ53_09545 [Bacteroidetes bacterium]|nr:MAG: hypothetical protein EAZ53_09545 [Bacteroidota bacterium]
MIIKMKNTFFIGLLITLYFNSIAQPKFFKRELDPALSPREHPLDFQELILNIAIQPKEGSLKGTVTHIFTPLRNKVDNFFLDAREGLVIKEAKVNGKEITFKRDTAGYTFYSEQPFLFGTKYSLVINYEAKPKRGMYFIGWNDTTNLSRKQIWTQGQGIDNRHWIPMYDEMNDKIISEVNITFDASYQVLSNGNKLKEKDNKDGTKTWQYRMPQSHAPYLIMLGIGNYEIKEVKSKSGQILRFYYYPDHKDRIETIYKYSTQIMDFYEKEIGINYPWKAPYSQIPAQDYMFGAMENTTATVFGDFYCVDARGYLDRNYVAVNAHELAHMWFGDMITARSSSDTWLQESFATHYQWIFDRDAFGKNQFDWLRKSAINQSLTASQTDKKAIASSEAGATRWYPKGAFVLEMIKYVVGREQYNRVIKPYLEKNAYKNVDSNELLIAFQDELGISLNWFWDEWVYKGGEPAYKVAYSDIKNTKNERVTEITVEQSHEINDLVGLFKMPIKFEVYYRDKTKDTLVQIIENQTTRVSIPNKNNMEIDFVLFDPNSQILKSVTFTKYQEEWMNQALRAPHMLDRYDAILQLKGVDINKKRETLISAYMRDKFHAIRAEIVNQLAADTSKESMEVLQNAITDKDVNVRKAIINNIASLPAKFEPQLRNLLKDSSYVAIETALEKLCAKYPEMQNEYLEITKNEIGNNHKNIRIKWLELQLNQIKNEDLLQELIRYSSPSYEFRTRVLAFEVLKKLNFYSDKFMENLAQAALHFNGRLAGPASQVIEYLYKQTTYKKAMNEFYAKSTLADKQQLKKWMK